VSTELTLPVVSPPTRIGGRDAWDLHLVLVEPLIPPNTGNAARLAAALGAWLHLVEPLGFDLDHKKLKRAGLDYWPNVRLSIHPSFDSFIRRVETDCAFFFSKFAATRYTDVAYPESSVLVFGKETTGLGPDILEKYPDRLVRIPTTDGARSINLSNSVAVAAYEVVRQHRAL